MKQVPIFVDRVVVTVFNNYDSLAEIYEKLRPTAIQIHGNVHFDPTIARQKIHDTRLIKTINVRADQMLSLTEEILESFDAVLIDSSVKGQYGGTGVIHDWQLSKQIREIIEPKPLILAGGLTSENVADAIRTVQPYAVDVASGVESSPGIKEPKKVYEFIRNARDARL
jgi:phosphoribosylanthranilate isomerase